MAYMDNLAPKRKDLNSVNPVDFAVNSLPNVASNQEQLQANGYKSTPSTEVTGKFNEGNLVQTQPNTKSTGVRGFESAIVIGKSKDVGMAPVENPDGKTNEIGGWFTWNSTPRR